MANTTSFWSGRVDVVRSCRVKYVGCLVDASRLRPGPRLVRGNRRRPRGPGPTRGSQHPRVVRSKDLVRRRPTSWAPGPTSAPTRRRPADATPVKRGRRFNRTRCEPVRRRCFPCCLWNHICEEVLLFEEREGRGGSRNAATDDGDTITVEAPPGTLGLKFDGTSTRVKEVFSDSPLVGKVYPGDVLKSVNGVLTFGKCLTNSPLRPTTARHRARSCFCENNSPPADAAGDHRPHGHRGSGPRRRRFRALRCRRRSSPTPPSSRSNNPDSIS